MEEFDWVKVESFANCEVKECEDYDKFRAKQRRELVDLFKLDPIEQLKADRYKKRFRFVNYVKTNNQNFAQAIANVKPDLIVVDCYVPIPCVITSKIPWINLSSASPLRAYSKVAKAPPYYSGYSVSDSIEKFEIFRQVRVENFSPSKKDYDQWLRSEGCEPVADLDIETLSPYLNVYVYPMKVDYQELGPVPEKWLRLDHCMRPITNYPLGIDEDFLASPGKKVFFGFGSGHASAFVDLMQKLIDIMSQSRHKFIIVKGEFDKQIRLYNNMAGGKFLNQRKIIPHVDLVIIHGGNNSFVESIYFGKPMIVMPFIGDQHDNARRVEDLKIGKYLDPWKTNKSELLDAIENILNDHNLIERMKKIGQSTRSSNSHVNLMKAVNSLMVIK